MQITIPNHFQSSTLSVVDTAHTSFQTVHPKLCPAALLSHADSRLCFPIQLAILTALTPVVVAVATMFKRFAREEVSNLSQVKASVARGIRSACYDASALLASVIQCPTFLSTGLPSVNYHRLRDKCPRSAVARHAA